MFLLKALCSELLLLLLLSHGCDVMLIKITRSLSNTL